MQTSLFISSDVHLCKFLQVTGGNWRSTLYVECCDCSRAISQRCKNLLCAFDVDGTPILVPEQDLETLWHTSIDKSECLGVVSKHAFCELYQGWISRHIRDPRACPLMDLHLSEPVDFDASRLFSPN